MYESLLLNAGGGIISDSSKAPQAGNACLMIGIGGTGSGCFLDVCYIVRDVIERLGCESTICSYFFLADTQLCRPGIEGIKPIEDYNKRNCYAALKELDYCMSLPSSGNVFEEVYAPGFEVKTHNWNTA
ncbi:MAG: tubulin-like doman-containing protein [Oscillospiraceae bacterium]|nr:tubulin-like doman-containing protein [Oscillospiraceae bacterium]